MSMLKILGSELTKAISYISPAIGSRTSAQQESSLVYIEALENSEVKFRIQSTSIIIQIIVKSTYADENLPTILVELASLERYAKNNASTAVFQFDLSEIENKDLLGLTIGDTFIGKIATVPLDAYELEVLDDKIELVTVLSSTLNSLISMSCQFANTKQDTQDYMQILIAENQLKFFTTDGDITAKFTSEQTTPEELDLTVRASDLKKLRKFTEDNIDISMTEDNYYMLLEEDNNHLIALVLHSDPPYSYQELKEVVDDETNDYLLSLNTVEVLTALKNLEGSATNGEFLFKLDESTAMNIASNDLKGNSTKIALSTDIDNYSNELSNEEYTTSIALFRKLTNITKKKGKIDLHFSLIEYEGNKYITTMYSTGSASTIDYQISFGINSV